jgi:hypothetical protein
MCEKYITSSKKQIDNATTHSVTYVLQPHMAMRDLTNSVSRGALMTLTSRPFISARLHLLVLYVRVDFSNVLLPNLNATQTEVGDI